ncbi:hypothetical protein Cgig2_004634 [Carnegiea gigantea]|uniref:Cytochrome P450 n=1 Tax=Carnegiea gigantea TaxID=171969 RepID=A0A9Q1QA26_9CARY|nr:hypothetical protein Cgig2_004634 [Carnegiea gigantea]
MRQNNSFQVRSLFFKLSIQAEIPDYAFHFSPSLSLSSSFLISYTEPTRDVQNKSNEFQWLCNLTMASPSHTFVLHRLMGFRQVITADPAVVEHMLKTHFPIYQKGPFQQSVLGDFMGRGIFNADGETWKFQRQIASYEFNTRSLRKFIKTVVDAELSDRLIPLLSDAAKNNKVLDLQDIFQRFAFDNICKISFGYDPEYLSPSLPQAKFAVAFEEAVIITAQRFRTFFPFLWKIQRFLNIASEKRLKLAVREVREFANSIVRRKKQAMMENKMSDEDLDLLSRILKSGHTDEKFVTDIVISFIIAGRDTTSSVLTWFFWLLHKNTRVEDEILREIKKSREIQSKETEHSSVFEQVKDMMYTHAALSETMRLYPPVPADTKQAAVDDVLPGGTPVRKGTRVTYHTYAMGRLEKLWGPHWAEYRPERWLQTEEIGKAWRFVPRDPYSYPVFQAGPRICLGKDMAFLQMKRVAAGILERFRVVPAVHEGFEPVFVPNLTAKMQGGLPVKIEERIRQY